MAVKSPVLPARHHRIRTLLAALLGALAVCLLLSSVFGLWLNRTLTDTTTFVSAVGPVASEPAVQTFVADSVTEQLVDQLPVDEAASQLLSSDEVVGKTADQLKPLLKTYINRQVKLMLGDPSFEALWKSSITSAHASLVSQLNGDSDQLELNLRPAIQGAISLLESSGLKPVAGHIELQPDTGKLSLKGSGISQAHKYYNDFRIGTWLVLVAAVLAAIGAVFLSVSHAKTARRLLVIVGAVLLVLGLGLSVPSLVMTSDIQQAAALAVARALFRNLQIVCLALGMGSIAAAIIWKVVEMRKLATKKPK